jgi:hypothetical protein
MQIVPEWPPVNANCTRVAASRMQIYVDFIMLHATGCHAGTICMRLAATRVQFAYDWRPLGYNLYVTGSQSHANFACASGQYSAQPPVFCKNSARTII